MSKQVEKSNAHFTNHRLQNWILSMKPQNVHLRATDSYSSLGALAHSEFLNKLSLSVESERESSLILDHDMKEWVRLFNPQNINIT